MRSRYHSYTTYQGDKSNNLGDCFGSCKTAVDFSFKYNLDEVMEFNKIGKGSRKTLDLVVDFAREVIDELGLVTKIDVGDEQIRFYGETKENIFSGGAKIARISQLYIPMTIVRGCMDKDFQTITSRALKVYMSSDVSAFESILIAAHTIKHNLAGYYFVERGLYDIYTYRRNKEEVIKGIKDFTGVYTGISNYLGVTNKYDSVKDRYTGGNDVMESYQAILANFRYPETVLVFNNKELAKENRDANIVQIATAQLDAFIPVESIFPQEKIAEPSEVPHRYDLRTDHFSYLHDKNRRFVKEVPFREIVEAKKTLNQFQTRFINTYLTKYNYSIYRYEDQQRNSRM